MDILSSDPVDLSHPSWCAAQSCTAPDRLAERAVGERDVPLHRRGSHFGEPHTIPASHVSDVEVTLELFRDVFAEVTDEPDGVLLSYQTQACGHAGALVLTGEQVAPLATAAAAMRDAVRPDRNPVVDEVAQALRVLGAITRTNADALLSLCVVHLTDRELAAVLDQFPGGER